MEQEKTLNLNCKEITKYVINRFPLLMIDYAEDVIPGKSGKGFKNVTFNEWYFPTHFRDEPVMPGVLQAESILQTAVLVVNTQYEDEKDIKLYLQKIKEATFYHIVQPGDVLECHVEIDKSRFGLYSGHGKAMVKDRLVCKLDFVLLGRDGLIKPSKE